MNNLDQHQFKCTGCFLCQNICPTKAITITTDKEGFYIYKINKEKCTNCGLCVKKCPKINPPVFNNIETTSCIAAYNKNETIVRESSSGGLFSTFANYILKNNGLVIGAAYQDNILKHIIIDNEEDLKKLRGSKYLQRSLTDIYNDIKKHLKNNKKVLFAGTPCQIGALKNIIQDDNLYTIDLVCHGVPSTKVFKTSLKERFGIENISVNFRKKENSWLNYIIEYQTKKINHVNDDWFLKYINNQFLKEDCYNCPFISRKRLADITLGDFWGIELIDKEFFNKNKDTGITLLLLNNKKGTELFRDIKKDIIYKEQSIEQSYKYNPRIFNGKYDDKFLIKRQKFFREYHQQKKMFTNNTTKLKIKRFIKNTQNKIKRVVRKLIKWKK